MKFSVVPLEEVCDFLSGNAWSASDFTEGPEGLPIIRIQNVDSVRETEFVYWNGTFDNRFLVQDGDILLTLSGSFRVVIWAGPRALLNQRIVKLIPKSNIHRDWLLYVVRNRLLQISGLGRHALVSNVALSDLRTLSVPLPPLPEQRRIAAILDQADALRAKRREALAQLDSLAQSIFIEMFGDPVTNERKWPEARVSDFVAGFETGKSLVAADEDDQTSEFRVLKISAVTSLEFKPEQSKALPLDYEPPESHFVRRGDLLFSRANTAELIGATALVDTVPVDLVLPDKLWRFVWHEAPRAAPRFVQHLFRQPKFRFEIAQRASGTSGSMKNISQEKVFSVRVGLPPLALQQTFATRIQAVESLKATHRAALAELNALFASLQHRAFAGQL
jgi:type I restriction enzyme S subunit